MRLRGLALAVMWSAAMFIGNAGAQLPGQAAPTAAPVSPIVLHYRAFNDALDRKDFRTADKEGGAALTAAEAAGDRRIGVLAFNLAMLRAFDLNDLEGAREPALRAVAAGGAGVKPDAATLLVTLTELPAEQELTRSKLNAAMVAARSAEGADVDFLYRVARAWGRAAFSASREESALEAYTHAVDLTRRMEGDTALDRALALTEMGALQLFRGEDVKAYATFSDALEILAPLSPESTGPNVPIAESMYGQVLAWRLATRARASAGRVALMSGRKIERPDASGLPPPCSGQMRARPQPEFPQSALTRYGVGAVVVRLSLSASGEVRRVQVIGAVPEADFSAAVTAVASRWRMAWDNSVPNCRRETDDYILPIVFTFGN